MLRKTKTVYAGLDCSISAIILGFNDALVEMTGALAGFTMALNDNRLIILAGCTTGVAATLSMAASEFFSRQADETRANPYLAALYTGMAYMLTVALLLAPYFILNDPLMSLAVCLLFAALIIIAFTFVIAKIRHSSFKQDCLQMLCVSFIVAAISFGISYYAHIWLGIDV